MNIEKFQQDLTKAVAESKKTANWVERQHQREELVHQQAPQFFNQLCSHLAECIESCRRLYEGGQAVFREPAQSSPNSWTQKFSRMFKSRSEWIPGSITLELHNVELHVKVTAADAMKYSVDAKVQADDNGVVLWVRAGAPLSEDELAELILRPVVFDGKSAA